MEHVAPPSGQLANASRRSALALLAAVPVAMLPAVTAAQGSLPAVGIDGPSAVLVALERHKQAAALLDKHYRLVEQPATDAAAAEEAAHPHYETVGKIRWCGVVERLSTADESAVRMARSILNTTSGPETADTFVFRQLVALADQREAEIISIRARLGIPAISEESDRLAGVVGQCDADVIQAPASTLRDLLAKADFITEVEGWGDYAGEAIIAELRRLTGEAA